MRNVSDKSCRENQNTHFVSINFFFFENLAVYEIMGKNVVEHGRVQMTKWRMRIACWIPKATNTHSEYVIVCFATITMFAGMHSHVTLYVHCFVPM